jgi:hypothetical protein
VKNSRARQTKQPARALFADRLTIAFGGLFAATGTYTVLDGSAALLTGRTSTTLTHLNTLSKYLGSSQQNQRYLRTGGFTGQSGLFLFFA